MVDGLLIGNEGKLHEMLRMKPHVFLQLCNVLQHRYGLQHTRHIRLEESVGICLMLLGQGVRYREWFKKDSNILVRLYIDIFIEF